MPADSLPSRVARFVDRSADPAAGSSPDDTFEALALAAFAFQYERIAPYRRLADRRGARPGQLTDWGQIPAVPTAAFKALELHAAPPRETFRSSGTTGQRSVHHHPYPDLYRRVIDATFPAACLPAGRDRLPILSLIPSRRQIADSSLGFMADHLLRRHGSEESRVTFGEAGVDTAAATAWAEARIEIDEPVLVLATAFALVEWLDALGADGRSLRLPADSVVFETGGFKGRVREITRDELVARTGQTLGVPPHRIVREYGMTELTSQLYTRVLSGGDPDLLYGPPWTRVRVLDPVSLDESPPGKPGLVAILDLANLGSAVHLLTQDLGTMEDGGLRLLGRASGAELRGCSLTVEELQGTP